MIITISSDETTTITRYKELQGILKMAIWEHQSGSEQGLADIAERDSLVSSYKTAITTYRELDGLVKQNAISSVSDADALSNQAERARVRTLLTAAKIDIDTILDGNE
jgi:hypothetical protein